MTLDEAKQTIRDDSGSLVDWVMAAGDLSSIQQSSFDDLLVCLKRGGHPASIAATALYVRTKRVRGDLSLGSFSMDYEDWVNHLRSRTIIS